MSPLVLRKQLLIAESELNRAQLAEKWTALRADVRAFTDRARSLASIVSAAALLVTGLVALRRGRSTPPEEKPAWWQTLLKAAGLVASVWQAFRTKVPNQEGEATHSHA